MRSALARRSNPASSRAAAPRRRTHCRYRTISAASHPPAHGPSALRAVAGPASATSAAAGSPPRKRAPRRLRVALGEEAECCQSSGGTQPG